MEIAIELKKFMMELKAATELVTAKELFVTWLKM